MEELPQLVTHRELLLFLIIAASWDGYSSYDSRSFDKFSHQYSISKLLVHSLEKINKHLLSISLTMRFSLL